MKKVLFFLLTFIPFFIYAETCDENSITIKSVEMDNNIPSISEVSKQEIKDNNVSLNINMIEVGKTARYKIVLENNSTSNYEIGSNDVSTDYIDYSIKTDDDSKVIKAKSTKVVYIEASYKNEVLPDDYDSGVFKANQSVQLSLSKSDAINPNTGNVYIICAVAIFLMSGMALYVLLKNKAYSKILIITAIAVSIVPLCTYALCKYNININLNINLIKPKTAMFDLGAKVNFAMKQLSGTIGADVNADDVIKTWDANYDDYKESYYVAGVSRDFIITSIKKADHLSENDNHVVVSTEESEVPIYMWFEQTNKDIELYDDTTVKEGIIYWYSEANIIYLNPNSSEMFADISNLSDFNDIILFNSSKVTNMVDMFYFTGENAKITTLDLTGWDTSNVEYFSFTFDSLGWRSKSLSLDLTGWDTSSGKYFNFMFQSLGETSDEWNLKGIEDWNMEKALTVERMFSASGTETKEYVIDISNWKTPNLKDMSDFLWDAGYDATTWSIGDLSDWDVSSVEIFDGVFIGAGGKSTNWSIGDLSNWDVSNGTNMRYMFYATGRYTDTWDVGDLSNWDTSNVTNMNSMFLEAGEEARIFDISFVSNWNVSEVTTMHEMFSNSGEHATHCSVGDLSNWDTPKVTDMSDMFREAGSTATTWNNIGTLNVYADNVYGMFLECAPAKVTLNIHSNPTKYTGNKTHTMPIFEGAATKDDALITVNYSEVTTNIDNIIATKSDNSNVVKGELLD